MKTLGIIILAFATFFSCNKPAANKLAQNNVKQNTVSDTANPKTSVTVNKKYDDKGNLLRYDSTYSYSYRSPGGRHATIGADTLYRHFHSYYLGNYDSLFNKKLGDVFFNDSLYKYDFLQPDYFSKRFELNESYLKNLLRQMDSIKTDYMKREYPQGKIERNLDKK
jgi:hypothetical protein